jgi:hypothetical protein
MMNIRPFKFLLILLPFIIGCSANVLENVRKVTYPPDFNYLSDAKIRGTMQQFAWYTELLDRQFEKSAKLTDEDIDSAISILSKMEDLSYQLGTETLTSNHDLISGNIDQFRNNLVLARKALQQSPPNTYPAGRVSAYCLQCHKIADYY